jgi:hypothetical protein
MVQERMKMRRQYGAYARFGMPTEPLAFVPFPRRNESDPPTET